MLFERGKRRRFRQSTRGGVNTEGSLENDSRKPVQVPSGLNNARHPEGVKMQPDLSLSLELLENTNDGIQFLLSICNQSDAKLLLPHPEVTGFRFVNKSTLEESKWCTMLLIEGAWTEFAINPGEIKPIEYDLQPVLLVPGDWEGEPAKWDEETFGDDLWQVVLAAGDYLVWYHLEVREDYFDGFSHYRFRDIQREAEAQQAIAWMGEQKSNRLHVVRV
jgi:hypothetical protein